MATEPAAQESLAVRALLYAARELPGPELNELVRLLTEQLLTRAAVENPPPDLDRRTNVTNAIRAVMVSVGRAPTTTDYLAAYAKWKGTDQAIPALSSVLKVFGRWSFALAAAAAAGPAMDGRLAAWERLRGRRVCTYTDERVLECLRACARDLGRPPSVRDYDLWRDDRIGGSPGRRRLGVDIPHYRTITDRFNGWENALSYAGLPATRRARAARQKFSAL